MIHDVTTVAPGRPATEVLAGVVAAAKQAGPLHPVTVVVASNLVGLSLRRLLASGALGGTGLANVGFLTPFQLAELLVHDGLDGCRPLTNPVLGAAARQALAEHPGPLASVVDHPATEAAAAAIYAELSQVSALTLDRLADAGGMAAVSVRLHRAMADRLGDFYGEPELAGAVARRSDLADEASQLGHLVWFLPQPVTPALEHMLAALVDALDTSVVVGLTGDPSADVPVVELCRRVGVVLDPVVPVDPPRGSSIIVAPDPDEEVRSVVRHLVSLAETGVPLDRVAVFYPAPDPYLGLLRQHLAEAGVPANGPAPDRLADSVAGRTLLAALALPDQHWRRDQVMALVAGAPVRAAGGVARPATWEALSRRAGVVAGLDDWARKLAARRGVLESRIDAAEGPEVDRIAVWEDECVDLDALSAFVESLADGVHQVMHADSWRAKADAAHRLLVQLLGPEHLRRWPDAELDAGRRVDDALARLAPLDELEPGPAHSAFVRALDNELDVARGRAGRFGEGVHYGPLASAAGQDLDAVVVVGMAEGVWPRPRREDSMLPDSVRGLAPAGELILRSHRLHDQHRALLTALAAAPAGRRLLTMPAGSLRRRGGHLPSRWLLDTASALVGSRLASDALATVESPQIHRVASHAEAIRAAQVPMSPTERDAGELWGLAAAGADLAEHPAVDGPVRQGIECLSSRHSTAFTAHDGNLAGVAIPSPTRAATPLSPTGLEQWATCGFRYFLDHVLHLRDRDDPERIRELSALDRGSGVHAILERFFDEVIAAGPPDSDEPWSDDHRARLREIADDELDQLERAGRTGRAVTWRLERERLLRLLDGFLSSDESHRARWRSRPVRVELPFGFDETEAVVIALSDGRRVHFRGKADRVDRSDDGHWIVLDYKTGRGAKYEQLSDDAFLGGTTLQLGLYAEAALQRLGGHDASAYYWIVDERAGHQPLGYRWTTELRSRLVELIEAMVDGIELGVFPMVPGELNTRFQQHDNCRFCQFDRVCPSARGSLAAAKAGASELRVRAVLDPPERHEDLDATPDEILAEGSDPEGPR